jgi:hypothetical protein
VTTEKPGGRPPGPVPTKGHAERTARHRRTYPPVYAELPIAGQVPAIRAAADHLTEHGYPPLFRLPVLRQLWRHGERDLAFRLARIRGAA